MKKQITEEKLLKELDIPDWRHMTKDKIVEFTSNMQLLDPEVAMRAIDQFPKFAEMGAEVVGALRDSLKSVSSSEDSATIDAYTINAKLLDNLNERLNKKFLLPGERTKIIEAMVEISRNITDIHRTHSNSVTEGLRQVASIAGSVALTATAAIGGKFRKGL